MKRELLLPKMDRVDLRAMGGNISMMASAKFFLHVEGDIDVASMVHA